MRYCNANLFKTLPILPFILSYPVVALSQERAAQIEEILVTAQRRTQAITDVPISVTAFSSDELKALRIDDSVALAQSIPGFTASRSFLDIPVNTIRGVGFNAVNVSSTSSVGIYMDEVSYAFPYMTKQLLFDLDRVEVLKGPQGTLYGRNTSGGLINYIAAKPGEEFEGSITAEIAKYDTFNVEGFFSGPLTETLGGRFAFRKETASEGWQRSVTRSDELGEKDKLSLRGILEWRPQERFDSRLTLNYWRDSSDTTAAQLLAYRPSPGTAAFAIPDVTDSIPPSPDNEDADWDPQSFQPVPDIPRPSPLEYDSEFYSAALQLRYGISPDVDLISLTSYHRVDRDDVFDADGSAREIGTFREDSKVESFQQELRLVGDYSRGSWTVGAYYSKDESDEFSSGWFSENTQAILIQFLATQTIPDLVDAGVLPGPLPFTEEELAQGLRTNGNKAEQDGDSMAVFASADFSLSDTLTLTGGVRYTRDELEFEGCSFDHNGTFRPAASTVLGLIFGSFPLEIEPFGCTTVRADDLSRAGPG